MDFPFIKMMVESFYTDNDKIREVYPNKQEFVNNFYTEMTNLMNHLKLEDNSLYFDLHTNYDRGQQQKVLYTLMSQHAHNLNESEFPFYEHLDDDAYFNVVISENMGIMFLSSIGVMVPTLLYLIGGKGRMAITKTVWTMMSKFSELNNKIHDFISTRTKAGKVKLAIVYNNVQECYSKAGIKKPEDIHPLIDSSLGKPKAYFNYASAQSEEQAFQLATCYLNWSLEQLDVLLNGYIACLRQTGERGNDLNDIKITLNLPSNNICQPYLELINDHRAVFKDVLDVICRNTQEREEYMRKYTAILNKNAGFKANINYTEPSLSKSNFTHKPETTDSKPIFRANPNILRRTDSNNKSGPKSDSNNQQKPQSKMFPKYNKSRG